MFMSVNVEVAHVCVRVNMEVEQSMSVYLITLASIHDGDQLEVLQRTLLLSSL